MIINFGDKATEDVYNGINSRFSRKIPHNILAVAIRKMDMINATQSLKDLKSPPGNHLEHLKGELTEFYSIRINDQFRIIFKMNQSNAFNVQIVDYH
jgi:toxin HigB-1